MKAKVVYNNMGVNMEAPQAKKIQKFPQNWQKFPQKLYSQKWLKTHQDHIRPYASSVGVVEDGLS